MKVNQFKTLSEATEALQRVGYTVTYKSENGLLKAHETGNTYKPSEVEVESYHRFEGLTNPGDMSILYAVRTNDNDRGLIVVPYGSYAESEEAAFMKEVKIEI